MAERTPSRTAPCGSDSGRPAARLRARGPRVATARIWYFGLAIATMMCGVPIVGAGLVLPVSERARAVGFEGGGLVMGLSLVPILQGWFRHKRLKLPGAASGPLGPARESRRSARPTDGAQKRLCWYRRQQSSRACDERPMRDFIVPAPDVRSLIARERRRAIASGIVIIGLAALAVVFVRSTVLTLDGGQQDIVAAQAQLDMAEKRTRMRHDWRPARRGPNSTIRCAALADGAGVPDVDQERIAAARPTR